MTKIRIGCSALTGKIYAGSVSKTGLWGKNKVDVTDEAIRSVAESLLQTNEVLQFTYKGDRYELGVRKIQGGNNEKQ
jgi:hypothetical protein